MTDDVPEVLPPEPQESALVTTDAGKLRTLADWFDHRDDEQDQRRLMIGLPPGSREVQADLRRMARAIDRRAVR